MPTNDKKRPMGLKARAAKKQKEQQQQQQQQQQVNEGGAQVVNDFSEDNTATIMLKNEKEDATELDELEGIYDSGLEELESDQERAMTLLRGTIHECDRILRVHHEEKGDQVMLESRFYYIYGMALFTVSELTMDEQEEESQRKEYLELAKYRLEQAKEQLSKGDVAWKVYQGLSKVSLELLSVNQEDDIDNTLKYLDQTMQHESTSAADLVDTVFSMADTKQLSEKHSAALVSWGDRRLKELPQTDDGVVFLQARALWLQASVFLDQQDEETGEVPERGTVDKLLGKAVELLTSIKSDGEEALLLLGEIQINLGNIQDAEESQEAHYNQAIATLKRAKEQSQDGELPEQFAQFIEEI